MKNILVLILLFITFSLDLFAQHNVEPNQNGDNDFYELSFVFANGDVPISLTTSDIRNEFRFCVTVEGDEGTFSFGTMQPDNSFCDYDGGLCRGNENALFYSDLFISETNEYSGTGEVYLQINTMDAPYFYRKDRFVLKVLKVSTNEIFEYETNLTKDYYGDVIFKPEAEVKPVINVKPLEYCWKDGGSFDISTAITSNINDFLEIKFYRDNAQTDEIIDYSTISMNGNPSTGHKTESTYYVVAKDKDGKFTDPTPIIVTIWQKPDVSLALSDGATKACYGTDIILTTANKNSFTEGKYEYYSGNASLGAPGGSSYKTVASASTTYFVYVTSGATVGSCKDTASIDITVPEVIAGGHITISVSPDKSEICAGQSLDLTASVTEKYTGTITYKWGDEVAVDDRTKSTVTVKPSKALTEYTVDALLDGCPASGKGSKIIYVNPLPVLTIANPAAVCGGTVDITQSGAAGTYEYYSDAELTSPLTNASAVVAGDYYVTLTDTKGCTSEKGTVTAVVNPNPTPKILVNNAAPNGDKLCAGTEIKLSCDDNTYETYTWTGGTAATNSYERNAKIVAGASNSFKLEVVDANGCKGSATEVAITGKAAPEVTIENIGEACKGDEVTLKATITWATKEQSILWEGNELKATDINPTTATLGGGDNKYKLTITDQNNCEAKDSITVKGNVIETLQKDLAINPTSVKAGEIVSLDITATWNGTSLDKNAASYTWKKTVSASESTIDNTKATTDNPDATSTYKVVVEKNGCKDSVSGDVTVETDPFELAGIYGYRAVCDEEDLTTNPVKLYVTASGGEKAYTYKWTVPSGMSVESDNTDTLKIISIDYTQMLVGTHEVKVDVSDPAGQGSKKIDFQILELPKIKINDVNGGAIVKACQGVEKKLLASVTNGSGAEYSWSTNEKTAEITASTSDAGTTSYIVTATYAGCSNKDSVKVQVNELPEIKLTAELDGVEKSIVCKGTVITLNATVTGVDAPDLVWSNTGLNGANPTSTVEKKTTYEVAYRDNSTTCEDKATVIVDIHSVVDLAVSVDPGSNVCAGSKVTLTASKGASYQWVEDGADIPSATADKLEVEPNSSVTYTVKGKDENGCEATPAPPVNITIIPAPVLVLSSETPLHGCVGGPDVDLAKAVDKTQSTPGIPLRVKDSEGNILSGTTVNEGGIYTLFLDNGSNSCSSNEENVTVIIHDKPNVSFVPDIAEVCSGIEVTLTASSTDTPLPTFTYGGTNNTTWKVKPENTGSVNTSITYTVTAKDSYGCTNTAGAIVNVKPLPDVKITDPGKVCAGSDVTLTASGADSYVWTGGTTQGDKDEYTVKPTSSNNQFFVTGTKDGCENTTDITLDVMDAPVLADARELEECVNSKVELRGAFTTKYTLSFFDENQASLASSSVTVTTNKTYYAKATVGTCSTDFKPIKVTAKPLPTVSIVGNDEICAGGETTLTANGSGIGYTWSPAGKGGTTQGASIIVDPSTTTTYTVTARGVNNCTAEATVEVKVNPLPELKWDAGNPSSLIAGETKTWNVGFKTTGTTTPYTYTWAHNEVVDNTYPNSNYSLTGTVNPEKLEVFVEDGKGCISKPIEASVPVTPQGGELTVALNAESTEICQGGMQMLTVTTGGGKAPYKYVWYKDGVDMAMADDVTTIIVTDAATYKVEVTDAGTTPQKKEVSKEMTVSASLVAPTVAVADLTIPTGNSTILLPTVTPADGSYTYQWSKVANLKDAGQETLRNPETKILTGTTPYEVVVKNGNGCYAKASGTVHVDDVHGYKVLAAVDPGKICIGNTAQLSATLSGNIPADVTYEWIPATGLSAANIANPEFTSTVVGTQDYLVKVTSTDGYVAVAQVAVETENKTAPVLALSQSADVSCVGEAITVTAQGGNITGYQWTIDDRAPISGSTTLDTLVAGNRKVKVTATAQNGCVVAPVEENYLIHDLPTIKFDENTPTVVDKGSTLTVTAIADNGAVGNYTYAWNTTGGTANKGSYTALMNAAKTFKVSVINDDTKCSSEEIQTTVKVQNPTPAVEITVKSENVTLCQNGISLLEVTGVKGGNGIENDFNSYKYEWTKAGNATPLSDEKSYAAITDGIYTVKVTEPKTGKSATKDITVTNSSSSAPEVANATLTIQKNTQAYLFASVTGGTPDYSYYWTPLGSLATSNTRENPTTSALSEPETFTCYVTDANGCSGKGDIQVNVVESTDPQLFTLLAKADNTNPCKGNIVQLSATTSRPLNNPTYEWTPATGLSADNIANPVFTANTAATIIYTVKVTEQGGYSKTAQVAITVKSAEAPRLELADNTGGCAGEKLTVENKNKNVTVANYHWVVNGALDNTVTGNEYPLAAGQNQTVKVYAEATNGCASDTTSGVFNRKPTPGIAWYQKQTSATEGDNFTVSVNADAGVTYVWSYVYTPKGGIAQDKVDGPDMNEFELVDAEIGTYVFTVYVEQDGCKSEELELTVTVLEKGVGLAVTTDVTSKEICENGSVLVTATGLNGSGTYTYAWYAGTAVSGNPVATGATVMLSPTVNGQKYVVEVNDGLTTAVSLPITLTFNNNTAPTIAGGTQNVAAGQSTILLSKVTQGAAASYHWSSPNDLLVSGDETKANPATKPLSDDETYTYYVKDANGCISKPADVKVVVDKAADALAIEATADMVNLCQGNVSHFKVSATKGTLSADAEYEWTPSTNLTGANTAEPVFTTTTGGNYPYLVTVRDQGKVLVASVNVTVKDSPLPEFAWDEPNCTASYNKVGDPITVTTKVTKETKKPYKYHWLKPFEEKNELHDYEVQTTKQPQYDFAVVMIDANGCQTRDTLKKHFEVGAADVKIEIKADDVPVCAVSEGVDGTATLVVVKTAGPDNVTYDWKPKGNTLTLTDADKANAIVNLSGVVAGDYIFTVKVMDANNNTNYAEKDVKLTVNKLPVFQIDEHCLALHKDSVFTLNVANTGDYSYLWRVSMYDKSQKQWGAPSKPEGPDNREYCGDKMSNQDKRYILKVEDNSTSLHCAAFDTAYVYRIPDAPLVEIDTNTSRLNIKLEWATVSGNDGYTVWSRKWDPYCMTSANGGVYKAEGKQPVTGNTWAEADMDTLEFYYVTAGRNVCGNTYHSLTSDTVGYKYDYLQVNANTSKTSVNIVSWLFDMSSVGVSKASDLLKKLKSNNNVIRAWDQQEQSWTLYQTTLNPLFGMPGFEDEPEYPEDFTLKPGEVYQFDTPDDKGAFLQYGKLHSRFLQKFTSSPKGTNTIGFLPFQYSNYVLGEDLMRVLKLNVPVVRKWVFNDQGWMIQITENPLFGVPGFEDEEEYNEGKTILRPGMPLQFDISDLPEYIWK